MQRKTINSKNIGGTKITMLLKAWRILAIATLCAAAPRWLSTCNCIINRGYLGRLSYLWKLNQMSVNAVYALGFQYSPYSYFNRHSNFCLDQTFDQWFINNNTSTEIVSAISNT